MPLGSGYHIAQIVLRFLVLLQYALNVPEPREMVHAIADDTCRQLCKSVGIFLFSQGRQHSGVLAIQKSTGLLDADEILKDVGFEGPELSLPRFINFHGR